jgi:preprotein translocase subunit SecG
MDSVVLIIHMILAIAIIGLVLLQRSEGGGLGIGGGGGGMGGLSTPQGTASAMTRVTWWCVAGFFVTSLTLGVMAGGSGSAGSIMNKLDTPVAATQTAPDAPVENAATPTPAAPVDTPAEAPSAPVAE